MEKLLQLHNCQWIQPSQKLKINTCDSKINNEKIKCFGAFIPPLKYTWMHSSTMLTMCLWEAKHREATLTQGISSILRGEDCSHWTIVVMTRDTELFSGLQLLRSAKISFDKSRLSSSCIRVSVTETLNKHPHIFKVYSWKKMKFSCKIPEIK